MAHKAKEAKKFFENASTFFGYDEGGLDGLEPERTKTNYRKYTKKTLIYIVAIWLFFTVVLNSIKKLGTEKIQTLKNVMHNEYIYDIESE